MADLLLERAYLTHGTYGVLSVGGQRFVSVERAMDDAEHPCIPEGVYTLRKRVSGVVERTTHGEYREGWEVTDVPGRNYIMIHVANVPSELEGCIAPGDSIGWYKGQVAVLNSLKSFRQLMTDLEDADEHTLRIITKRYRGPAGDG